MSKVPMKRIFICAMKKNRKQILETLQRSGVVEITRAQPDDGYLETMDVGPQKTQFERNAALADWALSFLETYAPDTEGGIFKMFEGPKTIDLESYQTESAACAAYMKTANRLAELEKQIAEDRAQVPKCETRLEALKPWIRFDLPMNYTGTKHTSVLLGSFPQKQSLDEIYQMLAVEAPDLDGVDVSMVSDSEQMTCVFVVCLKEDAAKVEDALKKHNFARAQLSGKVPRDEAETLRGEIAAAKADEEKCIAEVVSLAPERKHLRLAADYYRMRAEKYEVLGGIAQSRNAFFIEGYVPAKYADSVQKRLTGTYDAVVEISEPSEEDDVPVALQNGVFADPMETVVESYSMPSRNEFDPSKIMAPFYYIFFGMMFSDAGYGMMLAIGAGLILWKVKTMDPGMKKMMRLFFYSGLSTVFWGFMFGSFFGDAVGVIATTFFGRPDVKLAPIWLDPINEPMRLLVFAFLLGIIHLLTGLGVKGVELLRDKAYKDFVYDVVFWYLFVGGGILYLLSMPMMTGMMGLSFTLSTGVGTVSAAAMAIGGIGVVLTGGRESKNWFKRFLKGLYSAYGITGYLSDVLSYSRLLALGLATGVIAQVFNKMGSMLGATWYGVIVFILVFVAGHILNFGINVLGAYVHTNRLQFVEFFGKFYEGGGRKFAPFTEHTKYFKVKEEI